MCIFDWLTIFIFIVGWLIFLDFLQVLITVLFTHFALVFGELLWGYLMRWFWNLFRTNFLWWFFIFKIFKLLLLVNLLVLLYPWFVSKHFISIWIHLGKWLLLRRLGCCAIPLINRGQDRLDLLFVWVILVIEKIIIVIVCFFIICLFHGLCFFLIIKIIKVKLVVPIRHLFKYFFYFITVLITYSSVVRIINQSTMKIKKKLF